ncbi:TetR/AcrR family transcriptional regulator [Gordonia sp. CPCC 205515]|uniref:TetR/AcrR family transcriptional regulator n=1 Tax=Gordonia sp. CPCC 205515 TaxID=3140791 RepID=UPI003AF373B0
MTSPGKPDGADDEILRRGLAAFSELGYDHTTVRELAARMGVNRNFIGDRFGSKAAFWYAVVDFACRDASVWSTPDPALPDDVYVRRTIRGFYRSAVDHPDLHRLLIDESGRDSERLDYLYRHYIDPSLEHMWTPIGRLQASGTVPDLPRHVLFFVIVGPMLGMTHAPLATHLGRAPHPDSTEMTRHADELAALVISALDLTS